MQGARLWESGERERAHAPKRAARAGVCVCGGGGGHDTTLCGDCSPPAEA